MEKKGTILTGINTSLSDAMKKEIHIYSDYKKHKTIDSEYFEKMQVLHILEELGFPMDEIGTYLYKDVVMSALIDMKYGYPTDKILLDLNNPYSSTYQQIARDEYWIGVKRIHSIINSTISKIHKDKSNQEFVSEIFSETGMNENYGVRAFEIASYMYNRTLNDDNSKILEK